MIEQNEQDRDSSDASSAGNRVASRIGGLFGEEHALLSARCRRSKREDMPTVLSWRANQRIIEFLR
jgi:hypothetical protein